MEKVYKKNIPDKPGIKSSFIVLTILDLFGIMVIIIVNSISLLPVLYLGTTIYKNNSTPIILSILIPSGFLFYLITYVFVNAAFKWIIAGRLKCGNFDIHDLAVFKWFRTVLFTIDNQGFLFSNIKFFRILRYLYFWLLGAKIHYRGLLPNNFHCYEPELITIGDSTIIGSDAFLTCHVLSGNKREFKIAPIYIGEHCLIGAGAHILAGTTINNSVTIGIASIIGTNAKIGEHSIILNRSYVKSNQVIPDNEVWAGIPAKKIGVVSQ